MRMCCPNILVWLVLHSVLTAEPPVAPAATADLVGILPADHLLAVVVDYSQPPDAKGEPGDDSRHSMLDVATNIAQHLRTAGVLKTDSSLVGAIIDALTSAAAIRSHPYAIVVTEAAAKRIGTDSARLSDLQGALIVRTGGDHRAIKNQIQALLTARTDPTHSTIDRSDIFGKTVYVLSDNRLPGWAEIRWAGFGDYYVIGLGARGFEAAVLSIFGEMDSVSGDDWFLQTHQRIRSPNDQIIISVQVDRIREQLSEQLGRRLDKTLGGLDLVDVERGLWVVGRDGRAVTISVAAKRDGQSRTQSMDIARSLLPDDPLAPLIPDEATSYAVIEQSPARLIPQVRDAWLASGSPGSQRELRSHWAQFARDADVNVERDLLAHLGDQLIIHNYPPHPLHIPFMVTLVAPISGSQDAVRRFVDKVLEQCSVWLAAGGGAGPLSPKLERSDDGVWYFQMGVFGPAVTVHDQLLMVSYSPVALRQVIKRSPPAEPSDASSPGD